MKINKFEISDIWLPFSVTVPGWYYCGENCENELKSNYDPDDYLSVWRFVPSSSQLYKSVTRTLSYRRDGDGRRCGCFLLYMFCCSAMHFAPAVTDSAVTTVFRALIPAAINAFVISNARPNRAIARKSYIVSALEVPFSTAWWFVICQTCCIWLRRRILRN